MSKTEKQTKTEEPPRMGKLGGFLGYSLTSVIRQMGKLGWAYWEARHVFDEEKIPVANNTIRIQLSNGSRGEGGERAPIADELMKLRPDPSEKPERARSKNATNMEQPDQQNRTLGIGEDSSASGRLDTKLESAGAEFLVLGNLLLHRIPAYKTYTNMPGYDLVATNAERNTSARIQVKSRWETGSSGFPISNFDCDFVVAAFLNRGSKSGKKEVSDPAFYVFPISVFANLPRAARWNKVYLRNVPNPEFYRSNWKLIIDFLGGQSSGG